MINPFINQTVINKNNERGIVIDVNKERITVSFNGNEKLYNTEMVFNNHYLTFEERSLNDLLIKTFFQKQEELEQKKIEAHKKAIDRHKKVNARFRALKEKDRILKALFGRDFIYPPFEEFKKKYRLIIDKEETWFSPYWY